MRKPTTPAAFLAGLEAEQAELVEALRAAVRRAAPKATESVKQGWLFFEQRGPICFIQPHRRHVNLAFWRGAHLPDPAGRLEGTGRHMRHLKIASPADVDRRAIAGLVRAAARLNVEKPYSS
jgi:hypothetical protein